MRRSFCYLLVIILCLTGCTFHSSDQFNKEVTISAAASLTDAMNDIATTFTKKTGIKVNLNFASSGTLEKQIEEGAPVDLFISASTDYIDRLVEKNLVGKKEVTSLLSNQLVLIVPKSSPSITNLDDIKSTDRIAIGTPDIVPAGLYAKESLQSLHLWDSVQSKLIFAKDVRQVLSYVETGNVDAGFVYRSDALMSSKVKIVSHIPEDSHQPIIYPCAVIKKNTNTENFFDFLQMEAGQIFNNYGFTPIKKDK